MNSSSVISFEVVYGVRETEPLCYLITFDGFPVLLDCGWNESFDVSLLEPLAKIAKNIKAVLITFPDLEHCGALPYAMAKLGLDCPVYATTPVHKMGQLFLFDAVVSARMATDFTLFSVSDVERCFGRFRELSYTQTEVLEGSPGVQATPLNAGHMLGGAFWKLEVRGEQVVYMVDYNRTKERHLNEFVFEASNLRPSLLITDSRNALAENPKRKVQDRRLEEQVVRTMERRGNVLLPCDSAGRVLELLLFLEQLWARNGFTYSLALLSPVATKVKEFARGQLEWMGRDVILQYEQGKGNAFDLPHFRMCETREELDRLPKPAVVVTSFSSLELGFARGLFVDFMQNPVNSVIFTDRPPEGSLAAEVTQEPRPQEVEVVIRQAVRLEGAELEAHRIKARREREAERKREAEERQKLEQAAQAKTAGIEAADMDRFPSLRRDAALAAAAAAAVGGGGGGAGAAGPGASSSSSSSAPLTGNLATSSSYYFTGTLSAATLIASPHALMFPYHERATRWDIYGEFVTEDDGIVNQLILQGGERTGDAPLGPAPVVPQFFGEDDAHPKRYVVLNVKQALRCETLLIEWDARADGKSMENILFKANPNKLVFVHGSAAATKHIAHVAESRNICPEVYTPGQGEVTDLTSDTNVFMVKLTDALTSRLVFRRVGDLEVAYVEADIAMEEVSEATAATSGGGGGSEGDPKKLPQQAAAASSSSSSSTTTTTAAAAVNTQMEVDTGDKDTQALAAPATAGEPKTESIPTLEPAPAASLHPHQTLYLGDCRLADFQAALNAAGIPTMLANGMLRCGPDGSIIVRKSVAGFRRTYMIGASLDPLYFAVREILYSKFAVF